MRTRSVRGSSPAAHVRTSQHKCGRTSPERRSLWTMPTYVPADLIRLALRGGVDVRPYFPEVMLFVKLGLPDESCSRRCEL